MQCGAAVVPVAQFGTSEVQPIGAMMPKFFKRVEIRMGPALHFEAPAADDGPRPGLGEHRRVTDEIMRAIASLSGQEVVDAYANRDRGLLSAPGSDAEPTPPEERAGVRA
jgi:1-acyl-sn-glycerol-3-phosphate acyltransferase